MAELKIRPAQPDDAAFISDLLQLMGLPSSPAHIASRIRAADQSTNDAVLVATLDDRAAGFAALHRSDIFHEPGGIGRIKVLGVHPDHRRAGVGTALLTSAMDHFRNHGCIRMEVTSGEDRASAHAFYEACGMHADLRRFVIRLDANVGE